jgi:inorganic pyrophosphatase
MKYLVDLGGSAGDVFGDGDPVDIVEISSNPLEMGGVYQVKCLGAYAMIDDGELDWKVIAINTADPLAEKINDVEDVERHAAAGAHENALLSHHAALERSDTTDVQTCGQEAAVMLRH